MNRRALSPENETIKINLLNRLPENARGYFEQAITLDTNARQNDLSLSVGHACCLSAPRELRGLVVGGLAILGAHPEIKRDAMLWAMRTAHQEVVAVAKTMRIPLTTLLRDSANVPPADMPDRVTIWRGSRQSLEDGRKGNSWTTDRGAACFWALQLGLMLHHRHHWDGQPLTPPILIRRKIHRSEIAYFGPTAECIQDLTEIVPDADPDGQIDGSHDDWVSSALDWWWRVGAKGSTDTKAALIQMHLRDPVRFAKEFSDVFGAKFRLTFRIENDRGS